VCGVSLMVGLVFWLWTLHRGHRSTLRLGFWEVRQFCFQQSKYDPNVKENVFTGYPEQTVAFLKIAVSNADLFKVPQPTYGDASPECWSRSGTRDS
jgi:hypothetical protein